MNPILAERPDPRLVLILRRIAIVGAALVVAVPAARGYNTWLGAMPLWLLAMPLASLWALSVSGVVQGFRRFRATQFDQLGGAPEFVELAGIARDPDFHAGRVQRKLHPRNPALHRVQRRGHQLDEAQPRAAGIGLATPEVQRPPSPAARDGRRAGYGKLLGAL